MIQSPQRENIKPGVKFTLIKCSQVKDSPDFIITQKKHMKRTQMRAGLNRENVIYYED